MWTLCLDDDDDDGVDDEYVHTYIGAYIRKLITRSTVKHGLNQRRGSR